MSYTNANSFSIAPYSSILLVGPAGSGKSFFVQKIVHSLQSEYTPEQVKYALFDLKRVEFVVENRDYIRDYLLFDIVTDSYTGLGRLEELAKISTDRLATGTNTPEIFIYIEECNMATLDQGRFDAAVSTINKNSRATNMKLIYSTATPRLDTVSKKLLTTFEVILAGPLTDLNYQYLEITKPPLAEPYVFEVYNR